MTRKDDLIDLLLVDEIDADSVKDKSLDDLFFLQDFKNRKLFLIDDIDWNTIGGYVRNILQFNREDMGVPVEDRQPIKIYLSSRGGDPMAAQALIDAIRSSATPVWTINLGICYSAGFLIYVSGHVRYAMPNATFLHHDGEMMSSNSIAKTHDYMDFNRRCEQREREYLTSVSNVSLDEYDSRYRTEWYMFADEAKGLGFVDKIVGKDCSFDEIV